MADSHDRFRELVKAIEAECRRHRQDPGGGVLQVNESPFKVSLPGVDGERYAKEFGKEELLKGDISAMAVEFYAAYRAYDHQT